MHTEPAPAPLAELFLYLADRAQHVAELIRPALDAGEIVLTDRFCASTLAYQGAGRGLDPEGVRRADALLFLCPVRVGLARARGSDRFHAEEEAFHQRVQDGFLRLAGEDPAHWRTIDATQAADAVHGQVMDALAEVIG